MHSHSLFMHPKVHYIYQMSLGVVLCIYPFSWRLSCFQECINRMSNSNSPGSIVREGYFESISTTAQPPRLQDDEAKANSGKFEKLLPQGYHPNSRVYLFFRQVWYDVFHLCHIHLLLWFGTHSTDNIFVEKIYARWWSAGSQLWYFHTTRTAATSSKKYMSSYSFGFISSMSLI